MDFPHGETVTIRSTVTTTDAYGDTTTVVTDVAWGPCAIAPRTSEASVESDRPAVIVGITVYGPTVALDSDDQLIIDGATYNVEGHPGAWRSPFTGWAPGMEVAAVRAVDV